MRNWILLMMIGLLVVFIAMDTALAQGPIASWNLLRAARWEARAAHNDLVTASLYAGTPTVAVASVPAYAYLPARRVRPLYVQPLAAVSWVTVVPNVVAAPAVVVPYSMQTYTVTPGAVIQGTIPRACTQAGPAPCTPAGPN